MFNFPNPATLVSEMQTLLGSVGVIALAVLVWQIGRFLVLYYLAGQREQALKEEFEAFKDDAYDSGGHDADQTYFTEVLEQANSLDPNDPDNYEGYDDEE